MSAAASAASAAPAVESARRAGPPPEQSDNTGRGKETGSSARGDGVRALSGFNGNRRVPPPVNEPVKSYAPGSPERAALKDRLQSMSSERADIPLIIGGKEIHTGELASR